MFNKSVRLNSPKKAPQGRLLTDLAATYISQSAQIQESSPVRSPGRRSPRKKLGYDQDGVFDPEVNRAIARELYVDSTVNVVNPRTKGGGIKPGQMNLFNPKGQKSLAYSRSGVQSL